MTIMWERGDHTLLHVRMNLATANKGITQKPVSLFGRSQNPSTRDINQSTNSSASGLQIEGAGILMCRDSKVH